MGRTKRIDKGFNPKGGPKRKVDASGEPIYDEREIQQRIAGVRNGWSAEEREKRDCYKSPPTEVQTSNLAEGDGAFTIDEGDF